MKTLLVEDSPADARLIREMLKESTAWPFEIRHVTRLDLALECLRKEPFDVVLLDLGLPDAQGMESLALTHKCWGVLPIVVLTGLDDDPFAMEVMRAGAQDYLVKGHFDSQLLVRTIRYAVKRKEAEEEVRRLNAELEMRVAEATAQLRAANKGLQKEIVEHKRAEEFLRKSEDSFRALVMANSNVVFRMSADWSEMRKLLGRDFVADTDTPDNDWVQKYIHPDDRQHVLDGIREAIRTKRILELEHRSLLANGSNVWTFSRAIPLQDASGEVVEWLGTTTNIRDRKRAEEEREMTIQFLGQVNSSWGTRDLIQRATSFFLERSGCEAVGIRLQEGDDYPYFETRGFSQEFVHSQSELCVRTDSGEAIRDSAGNPIFECMCGNVVCGRFDPSIPFFTAKGSFYTNSTTELLAGATEADRQSRTRNRCNDEGYESVALFPLFFGEERIGLLQLNDRRKGQFSEHRIALWERLTGYLATAVSKFRTEEALQESEKRYRNLFNSMNEGFCVIEVIFDAGDKPVDFRYIEVNAAFERQTGLHQAEGKLMRELAPDHEDRWFEIYGKIALTGEPEHFLNEAKALNRYYSVHAYRVGEPAKRRVAIVFDDISDFKQAEKALRENEERLRLALEAGRMAAWEMNVVTGGANWNTEMFHQLGYDRESTSPSYEDWQRRVYPEDLPKAEAALNECLEHGGDFRTEHRVLGQKDELRWVEARGRTVRDRNGKAVRCFGVVMDTTERKRAEEALRQQAELLDIATDAIFVRDLDGTIRFWNRGAEKMYGFSKQQATGRIFHELLDTLFSRPLAEIEACVLKDGYWEGELTQAAQDGRRIAVASRWVLERDKDGQIRGIMQTCHDITARQKAEEAQQRALRNLQSVLESISDGLAVVDWTGRFTYFNEQGARLLGMSRKDLLRSPAAELFPAAEGLKFGEICRRSLKTQQPAHFEEFYPEPLNMWLECDCYPSSEGLSFYFRDITERKRAAELKQAEKMHRLLLEHTLTAQEEERRRIARELHDETGQSLTALLVGLRTLEDSRDLDEVKARGQELREITARTIDEIGLLARGLHPSVLDDLGLGAALNRYAAEYAKTYKIAVDLTLNEVDSSNLPFAVQIALYRILQEALTNVARHSGAETVRIRFTHSATEVEATVVDDGCGFDAKAVAVSSRRLGIHSMRERAAMLGGTVRFISQRKGTRIQVQIPLANPDTEPIAVTRSS